MPRENQVPSCQPNSTDDTIATSARMPPQTRMPRRKEKSLRVIIATAIRPTLPMIVTPAALSMMPGFIIDAISNIGEKISASANTKTAKAAYCAGLDSRRCATCDAPQLTSMNAPRVNSQLDVTIGNRRSDTPDVIR